MSLSLSRRSALFAGAGAAALPLKAWAQDAARDHSELSAAVDAYVIRCMAAFPDQPALGMALVKDGEAILTRGYGVKAMDRPGRADQHTLFAIASNTKNVTASALAMIGLSSNPKTG